MKKLYLPNVAYELLIDGKYHYYGSHCRSKKIYESQIKANSGNKLAAACNRGELSRAEYNTRVEVINVWEFNTAEEALDKELELITSGKQQYGDLCLNMNIGNNKSFITAEETKQRFKYNRDFFVECGKKADITISLGRSKQVAQFKNGELIAIYPSINAASRATGFNNRNICKAAQHKYKHAGGFQWEFLHP